MTATDDHGTLPIHAERMLRRLETIGNLAVPGDTAHMQHMDHAKRVHQLAHHLRAVLLLSEANHYASALIVVRSALEHHLMDRLIFLANRYIVTYTKVKKKDIPSWDVKLSAAQAGDQPDIATWFWDQSGMNVVHRGFHSGKSKKGRGQTISSYYFQVDDFDPFAGPKKHAGRLAAPFWERKHTQQWADESATALRAGMFVGSTISVSSGAGIVVLLSSGRVPGVRSVGEAHCRSKREPRHRSKYVERY
jgi:hypothetical protein